MRQALTTTPTALASITVGTRYSLQNRSGRAIYVEAVSTAPTDSGDANVMDSAGPLSVGVAKASSGESIFAWTATATGVLIYNEAP